MCSRQIYFASLRSNRCKICQPSRSWSASVLKILSFKERTRLLLFRLTYSDLKSESEVFPDSFMCWAFECYRSQVPLCQSVEHTPVASATLRMRNSTVRARSSVLYLHTTNHWLLLCMKPQVYLLFYINDKGSYLEHFPGDFFHAYLTSYPLRSLLGIRKISRSSLISHEAVHCSYSWLCLWYRKSYATRYMQSWILDDMPLILMTGISCVCYGSDIDPTT